MDTTCAHVTTLGQGPPSEREVLGKATRRRFAHWCKARRQLGSKRAHVLAHLANRWVGWVVVVMVV
jgi:hypothetical protein